MNDEKLIIEEAIYFIADKYLSAFDRYRSPEKTSKKNTKLITDREILDLFSALPFYVADEVIYFFLAINKIEEKYGEDLIRPEHSFFPLFPFWLIYPCHVYDIVENYHDYDCDGYNEYQHGLPIIHGDDRILFFTPALKEKSSQSSIYYRWGIDDPSSGTLCYSSLTNLLLMVSECYATDAYYFYKYSSSSGSWKEDFSKSQVIFQKHHPGLPFRSPHEIEHFLDD
jgi:hypothetical protein